MRLDDVSGRVAVLVMCRLTSELRKHPFYLTRDRFLFCDGR